MKRALKWLGVTLLFIVSFITVAYWLAKKYEDPVRNFILKEVNKRLASPVHVSDINFSLLENFPSASLVMDSIWAEENIVKIGNPDTLLFFEKLYLNLNIFEIINGKYKISGIEARRGFTHLLVDKKGYDNYHIWKETDDTTGFLLELSAVHFNDVKLRYINLSRNQDYNIEADEMWFKGKFSDEEYTMSVKGDGIVHHFRLDETDYIIERQIAVESELEINAETESYAFKKGRLLIDNELDFVVSGKLESDRIDLKIAGDNLDIIKTIALIPGESRRSLEDYYSSGFLDFECTLAGAFGKTENPRMQMKFSVDDAVISKRGSNWNFSELKGSGSLDNGEAKTAASTTLVIKSLEGKFNDDPFSAQFSWSNFDKPIIQGSLKMETDLKALDEFFEINWMEDAYGQLSIDAALKIHLDNINEPKTSDFINSRSTGKIELQNAFLRIKDDAREYHIDSAVAQLQNNNLNILHYGGRVGNCDLVVKGQAEHFLDYLFTQEGHVNVIGTMRAGEIDLQLLFPSRNDASNDPANVVVAFPKSADWNLGFQAKSFKNGKFIAEDITGELEVNAFKAEANNLSFKSQEGLVSGKVGLYRFGKNQFGLRTEFDAKEINIKTLFETFNEFDQDFITSSNLKGKSDAIVAYQVINDSLFNTDMNSIIASINLTIRKGSLSDFEPLISVADELKKKKILSLFISTDELRKRLQDVQFDTLQNEITIRNGVVNIPEMKIRSSAIDMNISGTHGFDDHIHYEMDFMLSELLNLKDRIEPYNEYVQREPTTGRTRIFVVIDGTTEDFNVEIDRARDPKQKSQSSEGEKQQVLDILKDEFKSMIDSAITPVEKEPNIIQIDFNPEGKPVDQNKAPAPPASKEKNPINKIIKKTETDKKKLKEGDFDDDDF